MSQWQVLEKKINPNKDDPKINTIQMEELYKFLKEARQSPFKAPLIEKILKQMGNRTFPPHIQSLIKQELSHMEELNEQHKQEIEQLVQSLDEQRSLLAEFELKFRVSFFNKNGFKKI